MRYVEYSKRVLPSYTFAMALAVCRCTSHLRNRRFTEVPSATAGVQPANVATRAYLYRDYVRRRLLVWRISSRNSERRADRRYIETPCRNRNSGRNSFGDRSRISFATPTNFKNEGTVSSSARSGNRGGGRNSVNLPIQRQIHAPGAHRFR